MKDVSMVLWSARALASLLDEGVEEKKETKPVARTDE